MKKISPSIVMVEDISSSLSRATFSEADLEKAAQLILQMEGTITPIILQKVGIDSYVVIEGDFEYYAALRAEEIDPMKGETINTYVIESKKDLPFYQKQIEVFRKQSVLVPAGKPVENKTLKKVFVSSQTVDIQPIMNAINNLSERFDGIVNQQSKRYLEVDKKFDGLQEKIANISIAQPEKPAIIESIITSDISTLKADFLDDLNNQKITGIKLESKLKQIRFNKKVVANKTVIKNIILERRKKPFKSLIDVVDRVDKLGDATLVKILDNWN